jgi:hypothetical protein
MKVANVETVAARFLATGRLKTELFYPGDWQATTIDQFIEAVDSYIRWYNEKRIKISLGSLSNTVRALGSQHEHKQVQHFRSTPLRVIFTAAVTFI